MLCADVEAEIHDGLGRDEDEEKLPEIHPETQQHKVAGKEHARHEAEHDALTGALNRGSFYYYWTSAPSAGTKSCCLAFKNDWKEVDPLYTFQRGNAQTIRCVKE